MGFWDNRSWSAVKKLTTWGHLIIFLCVFKGDFKTFFSYKEKSVNSKLSCPMLPTHTVCSQVCRRLPEVLLLYVALKPWCLRTNELLSLMFSKLSGEGPLQRSLSCSPQVDGRDWALNGNTLSLDEETVIDVPAPYSHVSKYCASLGHKANHSFTPNCIYDM